MKVWQIQNAANNCFVVSLGGRVRYMANNMAEALEYIIENYRPGQFMSVGVYL